MGAKLASMAFRLFALFALLLGFAGTAQAQSVSDADRAAIRQVIQAQVDAFRRDDGDAAFGSPRPRSRACSARRRSSWTWCGRAISRCTARAPSTSARSSTLHGQPAQKVDVIGPDGRPVTAIYPMRQLPDGTWRIDGCFLQAPEEHQA